LDLGYISRILKCAVRLRHRAAQPKKKKKKKKKIVAIEEKEE